MEKVSAGAIREGLRGINSVPVNARIALWHSQKPAAVTTDLEMFDQTHRFLREQYLKLRCQKLDARQLARVRELQIRNNQLHVELSRWMERQAE